MFLRIMTNSDARQYKRLFSTQRLTSKSSMPASSMPIVVPATVPMISLEAFKGDVNLGSILDKIAFPVLDQQRQSRASGAKIAQQRPKESLQDSLHATEDLVQQFERSSTAHRSLITLGYLQHDFRPPVCQQGKCNLPFLQSRQGAKASAVPIGPSDAEDT